MVADHHAGGEASIRATALHRMPLGGIGGELREWRWVVGKTGGSAEHEAMDFLDAKLKAAREAAR